MGGSNLQAGDKIISIAGSPVTSLTEVNSWEVDKKREESLKRNVQLTVWRDEKDYIVWEYWGKTYIAHLGQVRVRHNYIPFKFGEEFTNDLPPNWVKVKDPKGNTFYWNTETETSTLEKPTDKRRLRRRLVALENLVR